VDPDTPTPGVAGAAPPFSGLRAGGYDLIMADPPWLFKLHSAKGEAKSAQAHYRCMDLAAIKALPVAGLAAPDCLLWLWATNPMLPAAFEVLTAWGFAFKTAGHWSKKTKYGHQAFGTGFILRGAGEPFLIGTRGAPKTSRTVRSVVEGPVRGHSRKPDEAYAAAELLMPEARRADLFARQTRPGWTAWGDETTAFDPAPAVDMVARS
jgi:N6-adenosine-specific RNA methylase IME4